MATRCSSRAQTSRQSGSRPPTSSRPPAFADSIRASSRTESTSRRRPGRLEMAEAKEPKADVKAAKKAKKTAVPEAPEPEQALPTAGEIRAAKKAELLVWSERYGLSQEGKVDDLRQRLRAYIEKKAVKAATPEEEKPAPPKAEKRGKEKAKEEPKPPKEKKGKKEEAEEEAEEDVHEPRAKAKLGPHLKKLPALRAAKQAVRIAHAVGTRKRELIEKACDEKGLRVLNRMVTE